MTPITFTITFSGATGGDVNVAIMGPGTNLQYEAKGTDPRPDRTFDLMPGLYTVRVHGLSGGTVGLSVDNGAVNLITASCPPSNIYLSQSFPV